MLKGEWDITIVDTEDVDYLAAHLSEAQLRHEIHQTETGARVVDQYRGKYNADE